MLITLKANKIKSLCLWHQHPSDLHKIYLPRSSTSVQKKHTQGPVLFNEKHKLSSLSDATLSIPPQTTFPTHADNIISLRLFLARHRAGSIQFLLSQTTPTNRSHQSRSTELGNVFQSKSPRNVNKAAFGPPCK